MKTYHVWYRKEPIRWVDKYLTVSDIAEKYCLVSHVKADCLYEVFEQQQSEVWSPGAQKEMEAVIKKAGLNRTSMGVGDVAEVNGTYYQVDLSSWRKVE